MSNASIAMSVSYEPHVAARLTGPEREGVVQRMFSSIAGRYDLANTILSLGQHRRWKRAACRMVVETNPVDAIDVGAGTCDLTVMLASECSSCHRVMAVDLNAAMLSVGMTKIRKAGCEDRIRCFRGSAEALHFRDEVFDAAMAGFCIRNVGHLDVALHEMYRVIKPGGLFVCLEFSRPPARWLRTLYDGYSLWILPRVGAWVAGDRTEVYQYLPSSIREFPDQEALASRMKRAGFRTVDYRNLSGGIVAIHRAVK